MGLRVSGLWGSRFGVSGVLGLGFRWALEKRSIHRKGSEKLVRLFHRAPLDRMILEYNMT